mmetsp:Transcript_36477/g.59523  ORF Transcript_36477/g.59523 Transcript_36477/m.59523 type:complete len:265 (+) Transcript_36477:219-1013(+)
MPSRKRMKGKPRKAQESSTLNIQGQKQRQQEREQQHENHELLHGNHRLLHHLIGNLSLQETKKCHHNGCTPPPPGDICDRFLSALVDVLNKAVDVSPNPIAAHSAMFQYLEEKAPELTVVWDNEAIREKLASYLAYLGTEYLLQGQERYTKMASAIALAVLSFEMEPCANAAAMMRDLNDGNERETVRFFSKRINCSCLRKKCRQLKSQPKLSVCYGCKQKKERKELMLCTRCKFRQYCSKECQQADWLGHRTCCTRIADRTMQ